MAYGDNEPTWGVGPNLGASQQPHSDYREQASQHFGGALGAPGPYSDPSRQVPVSYGALPSLTRESFVQRLMERGVRGELIRQPWFQNLRNHSASPLVISTYAGAFVVSVILGIIPGVFFPTLLNAGLWGLVGFLFFAVGTKLAHQFIMFGICLVGALKMALQTLSILYTLAAGRGLFGYWVSYFEPMAFLILSLLLSTAIAGFLIYVGLQVNKGVQRLSAPPLP